MHKPPTRLGRIRLRPLPDSVAWVVSVTGPFGPKWCLRRELPKHSPSETSESFGEGVGFLRVGHVAAFGELDKLCRRDRRGDDSRCALEERIAVEPRDCQNRESNITEIVRGDDEG